MIFIQHIKIIKITTHGFGWHHGCEHIETATSQSEIVGQHAELDLRCYIQLRSNALLISCDFGKIGNILLQFMRHGIKGVRQQLNFIASMNINLLFQITLCYFLYTSCQFMDGAYKLLC